jgi:hypothetical protein
MKQVKGTDRARPGRAPALGWAVGAVTIVTVLVAAGCSGGDDGPAQPEVRPQAWQHVAGTCPPAVEGAVFARSGDGCGGPDASFDVFQTYLPSIVRDTATAEAPCGDVALGEACYRMWYVGNTDPDDGELRRIGYAVSPDGVTWTRIPGGGADGSVLDPGPEGSFDDNGHSAPTVIRDGDHYAMWYTGLGEDNAVQGLGMATSTDGVTWERVAGTEEGGAVLRETGEDGRFDEHQIITSTVLKDLATADLPCAGVEAGEPCYRMWFEGVDTDDYYRYRIGYATSPDGVAWTKIDGADPSGAVFGLGPKGSFESKGVGVPNVIKDGALFQMWYEAFDGKRYSIGHATSPDGITWTRAEPNGPALIGADDPGTYEDDYIWTGTVVKEGDHYRMWYSVSSKPDSNRLGLALLEPGAPLGRLQATATGDELVVDLETAVSIPAGGSLLVTLPAGVTVDEVTATSGFPTDAAASVEAAVTDADAQGVARDAVLVRIGSEAAPGPKSLTVRADAATRSGTAIVQTFAAPRVLERGTAEITPQL